jgi:nucleoside-diphosphate-sugar epimerase
VGRVRPPRGRFAPTVHGPGDRGFIASLAELARRSGVAGYIDEGANRWPAVHRLDAAALVRIAVESPASGPVVHAVGEQGVTTRDIATALSQSLGVAPKSIPAAEAATHFGWIAGFFAMDAAASNVLTRERTGVEARPRHTMLADIAAGSYKDSDANSII